MDRDPDDCVFCQIVEGRRTASEVFRDESVLVFLDHSPLFKGHLLVMPFVHHVVLADLPAAELTHYFEVVQACTTALVEGLGSQGSLVVTNNTVSQSVPHLHTHVVPRTRGDGLRGFFWPRTKYSSPAEADEMAQRIASRLIL